MCRQSMRTQALMRTRRRAHTHAHPHADAYTYTCRAARLYCVYVHTICPGVRVPLQCGLQTSSYPTYLYLCPNALRRATAPNARMRRNIWAGRPPSYRKRSPLVSLGAGNARGYSIRLGAALLRCTCTRFRRRFGAICWRLFCRRPFEVGWHNGRVGPQTLVDEVHQ